MTAKDLDARSLCLQSIDHCKMFAPIAEELGIEPDGTMDLEGNIYKPRDLSGNYMALQARVREAKLLELVESGIPTYRQDKLELPLPEWCFNYDPDNSLADTIEIELDMRGIDIADDDFLARAEQIEIDLIQTGTGELKRQATVELVCLLKEEGLL